MVPAATQMIDTIAFSPDGRMIAVSESAGAGSPATRTIRVSETDSGRELRAIHLPEDSGKAATVGGLIRTRSLVFSADGQKLALLVRDEASTQAPVVDRRELLKQLKKVEDLPVHSPTFR